MAKIAGWGFGVSPALSAAWSNGIHTTTISGTYTHIDYPTHNEINSDDGETTFTQKYAPLRDLTFTVLADYTHKTISSGLQNSIPTGISTGGPVFLGNGIYQINGGLYTFNPATNTFTFTGPAPPILAVNGPTLINPFDQYTATAEVDKQFGGEGIFSLSDSVRRTDFEKSSGSNYGSNTLSENGSFALGPIFYLTTSGSLTTIASQTGPDLNVYRLTAGIGTRQIGLWRASFSGGYQGSKSDGGSAAGGEVFDGSLTYYATPLWTLSLSFDETINRAAASGAPSNFALNTSLPTALQIPITSSTQVVSTTFTSSYRLTPQWMLTGTLGYTHAQFLGSSGWDDAWVTDLSLRYDIWRDLTLSWEYRYSGVVSNLPGSTAASNFITMSAQYRF